MFGRNKFLDLLTNKFVVYLSLSLVIFFASIGASSVPLLQSQFYSILFAIIILYFSTSKNKSLLLSNIVFDYLGKISYGLYISHPIAIIATLKITLLMNFESNWFIYILSFSASLALSALSYSYFEKFFRQKTSFIHQIELSVPAAHRGIETNFISQNPSNEKFPRIHRKLNSRLPSGENSVLLDVLRRCEGVKKRS